VRASGKFLNALAWAVDLPDEPVPGRPLVEIIDNNRVLIENHCGVCEYGGDAIRVKTKTGAICIFGNKLEISRMTKCQLIITGNIESVRLCRG
jgi:sporulation protein YqfC